MKFVVLVFLIVLYMLGAAKTHAAMEVNVPLSFGTFAIPNNSLVSQLTISTNYRSYSTNHIHVIQPGQPGEFKLVEFPVHTRLFLNASLPQQSTVFVGETERFTLTNIELPDSVITDSNGEADLLVGATIKSSGNGGRYLDTKYDLPLIFTINY